MANNIDDTIRKREKLKSSKRICSEVSVIRSQSWRKIGRLRWEGFAERKGFSLYTDDLLWRNYPSPQCRNCIREPDHAHLGSTHSSQD